MEGIGELRVVAQPLSGANMPASGIDGVVVHRIGDAHESGRLAQGHERLRLPGDVDVARFDGRAHVGERELDELDVQSSTPALRSVVRIVTSATLLSVVTANVARRARRRPPKRSGSTSRPLVPRSSRSAPSTTLATICTPMFGGDTQRHVVAERKPVLAGHHGRARARAALADLERDVEALLGEVASSMP